MDKSMKPPVTESDIVANEKRPKLSWWQWAICAVCEALIVAVAVACFLKG